MYVNINVLVLGDLVSMECFTVTEYFVFFVSFYRDMDGRGRGMDQGRNGGGRFGSPDFHNGDVNMMMMLEEPVVSFHLNLLRAHIITIFVFASLLTCNLVIILNIFV